MQNDLLAQRRAPATSVWRLWDGAILPCHCKLIVRGEPRLVGLYFRTASVTRCIVRLEWRDGQHWVREALDAPWHVHSTGPEASEAWADMICDKVALEWACDELKRDLDMRRVA